MMGTGATVATQRVGVSDWLGGLAPALIYFVLQRYHQ